MDASTLPRSDTTLEPAPFTGFPVLSGTGEDLGVALGVEHDRFGRPKWLSFQEEPGAAPRRVKLDFIRSVDEGEVRLAGPREGYHITRLRRG